MCAGRPPCTRAPTPSPAWTDIARRLDEPLRVAFAGKVKAGKSTLLNALVGEPLAATDATECTKIVTWYVHGTRYRVTIEPRTGSPVEVGVGRNADGIAPDLAGYSPDDVNRLVVEWPSSQLQAMTLIDTPGVGSLAGLGRRTTEVLMPNDEDAESSADVVIYLTPHLHPGDLRFLEPFRDATGGRATPVNAVAVLSRADEIGGARLDSMDRAARIAQRNGRDPAMRRLCHSVVPVAGLLAQAAATMTERDFRLVNRVAALTDREIDDLLVSADHFAGGPCQDAELDPATRSTFLDRFGLFGVRLAVDLVRRQQCDDSAELADALLRTSGIDDLRRLLAASFTQRRDVLKARSALAMIRRTMRRWPSLGGAAQGLQIDLERITAGAHELAELRVLAAVRAGDLLLQPHMEIDLIQILSDRDPLEALGIDDPAGLMEAIVSKVATWRAMAEHPIATPELVAASDVVVRTLERMAVDVLGVPT